ncbi:MAG: YbgC/FadM family acyl-CoA thioesterase [Sulfurospirillaceae bacterium]|nr:YbgC/FadM family acyl-CoA thioesterase [Sulfurospirillaceae bacterium]
MQIRVYYEDTDAGGIVYHANYLKFCERSRSELFFAQGKTPTLDGGHFVIKHIDAEYSKSAKLGDMLEVKNKIIELRNSSMKLNQCVYRDEEKLFDMTVVLVFAKDGKPIRIDDEIRSFLHSIEL